MCGHWLDETVLSHRLDEMVLSHDLDEMVHCNSLDHDECCFLYMCSGQRLGFCTYVHVSVHMFQLAVL